ncbi:hypothetical protein BJ138DRAFT_1103049, partial [Hygrophoropsis aurantiaca]
MPGRPHKPTSPILPPRFNFSSPGKGSSTTNDPLLAALREPGGMNSPGADERSAEIAIATASHLPGLGVLDPALHANEASSSSLPIDPALHANEASSSSLPIDPANGPTRRASSKRPADSEEEHFLIVCTKERDVKKRALTGAERNRRYREKKKATLTEEEIARVRADNAERKRKNRALKKQQAESSTPQPQPQLPPPQPQVPPPQPQVPPPQPQ